MVRLKRIYQILIAAICMAGPSMSQSTDYVPCSDLSNELPYQCLCSLGPIEEELDDNPAIYVNCDGVVFPSDIPPFPYGAPIVSFSQKFAGHQSLPSQVFSSNSLPLRSIDLSSNSLRKLTEGMLESVQKTLLELNLSENLLGDTLNPIFSTGEFRGLKNLRVLNLSGNGIKAMEEGILEGCSNLEDLFLDRNDFNEVPDSSLNGPKAMKLLSLSLNNIGALKNFIACHGAKKPTLVANFSIYSYPFPQSAVIKEHDVINHRSSEIQTSSSCAVTFKATEHGHDVTVFFVKDIIKTETFIAQKNLHSIDLSQNLISQIESGTFSNLNVIRTLKLNHNKLSKFNSDVFYGAETLATLDLSENFIVEFPSQAFKGLNNLKSLNLSSNMIQALENSHLQSLSRLQQLDLSRNALANIVPGTFLGLSQLRLLDVSVNSLRTIEDDAFEGLQNLETLILKDNNILLIPSSSLGRLPRLTSLQLDYNRITALSGDILKFIAGSVQKLVLSTNVVRELPSGSFQFFKNLNSLDLKKNFIASLNKESFIGLENTLEDLNLRHNRITQLTGGPLALKNLKNLDISDNRLSDISITTFVNTTNLRYLNLSHNAHLVHMPMMLVHRLLKLEVLDISYTGLKQISPGFLAKSRSLEQIIIKHTKLNEIEEATFTNMPNLTLLDLSYNNISAIKQAAFVHIMNLKTLNLKGNNLNSFRGEAFNTGTSIEILDISNNQISYLYPSTFKIHPRLQKIYISNNKLSTFSSDLISNLQFLNYIDLSGNQLKSLEDLGFARLPRLRTLVLKENKIEDISEMSFHNSTQLQVLDLSYNNLERLGDRIFEGLIRLEYLNLEGNRLMDLPELIFDRARLHMLENINLAKNKFEIPPFRSLQKQYFFLTTLDLSHNNIENIPADDDVIINVKKLDLSNNPLSQKAISNILSEPKTVRHLQLAGTGVTNIKRLETPFLKHLNLSSNNISKLEENIFERTTLLEELDVSHNKIKNLKDFDKIWILLKNLKVLNISNNPIEMVSERDFIGLNKLRRLGLHTLEQCTKIEKTAFKYVPNLCSLDMYGYPKVGYLDINNLLSQMPALERVNIETKDDYIGKDQLQPVLHSRLKELGIRGARLKTISSGTFSGLKGAAILIRLVNTSLVSLPPALFFPVPRSSKTTLDVTDNELTTLNAQLLTALEDRRGDLVITGLESNPIVCDCHARALRRWLPSHMTMVKCSAPEWLKGKFIVEIGDDELSCDPRKIPTETSTQSTTSLLTRSSTKLLQRKNTESDIIWSMPSTEKTTTTKGPVAGQSSINSDDTLIIGIVGGVVAFIAILIIVICIIRLRMSSSQYRGTMPPGSTIMVPDGVLGSGSSCACSVKGIPPGPGKPPSIPSNMTALYAIPPGYSATLPHKGGLQGMIRAPAVAYSTMGRAPAYYPQAAQPYFIATYPSDEKVYR